jgi:hypothetical protein
MSETMTNDQGDTTDDVIGPVGAWQGYEAWLTDCAPERVWQDDEACQTEYAPEGVWQGVVCGDIQKST